MSAPKPRTRLAVRNVGAGLATQAFLALLSFVSRAVFVQTLGIELLGVNALFTSVLTVLTIADLGLNTAIMYALYKPLSTSDWPAVAAVVRYCARLYRYVAAAVMGLGLLVMPFLGTLVNTAEPVPHLEMYFAILLAHTALTYLMSSRMILLMADQRYWVTRVFFCVFDGLRVATQIVVLVALESYLGFVIVQAVFTLVYNLALYLFVGRSYPQVRVKAALPQDKRREIQSGLRSVLVYRVSGAALNNTDAVLISVLVGTAALGRYSNYMLVIASISMFTEQIFRGLAAGFGHMVAETPVEHRLTVFRELSLAAFGIYSVGAISLVVSLNDLIGVWLGDQYVLPTEVVVFAVLNFYMYGMLMPVAIYRSATGMFRDVRYVLAVTATLNLILSIVLGHVYGIAGVLAATAIARLLTNVWYEPRKLLVEHLGSSPADYYVGQVWRLILVAALSTVFLVIPFDDLPLPEITRVSIQVAVVAIASMFCIFALYRRTTPMRGLLRRVAVALGRR